jgi:pyrroloquinoline quinone (PQQ) biosynthesis protein C
MGGGFTREGDLKNTASYPLWLQEVLLETGAAKSRVMSHPLFRSLRDCELGPREMRAFLINGWPVINQFPQYMGMNLQKIGPEETPGSRMARRYLTRNIRRLGRGPRCFARRFAGRRSARACVCTEPLVLEKQQCGPAACVNSGD